MKLLVVSLLLSSCAPKPPDVPVCKELKAYLVKDESSGDLILRASPACKKEINEIECGVCTHIVSGKTFYVGEKTLFNQKTWSQLKTESILVPAVESYAPLSSYLVNSCKALKCDKDAREFKSRLDEIEKSR